MSELKNTQPVWLLGGKASGRLQVLVEVPGRGWVLAIDERWPGGEEEISHIWEGIDYGAHEFRMTPTQQGNRCYSLECRTCGELVHEATTEPREAAAAHVLEFDARSRR